MVYRHRWYIYTLSLWWTYKKLLNMAIEIVDFPINSMVMFHCYVNVHQRVWIIQKADVGNIIIHQHGITKIVWELILSIQRELPAIGHGFLGDVTPVTNPLWLGWDRQASTDTFRSPRVTWGLWQREMPRGKLRFYSEKSSMNLGLSENVVYPIVPNGFADHYPY